MLIIPAINCGDWNCVKNKTNIIKDINSEWIHFDVCDGKFARVKTWNEPVKLNSQLTTYNLQPNIEVHLMVEKPELFIDDWLKIAAKRIIIHLESIVANIRMNTNDMNNALNLILEKCSEYDAELMIALKPETPVEEVFPYLEIFFAVQFLAVNPGFSGQKFQMSVLDKIKILKERQPDILIEIDGGINLATAKLVKEVGADIIVAGSYIFNHSNPLIAFNNLKSV